ncbi:MAG: hypothetical protein ACRDO4_03830 [Nocardioides sp.]
MRIWAAAALLAAAVAAIPTAAQADVVAHWHMDEGDDASVMEDAAPLGGGNDGMIRNVMTGDPGLVSGRSYTFDGSTSYVEVPDSNSLDPGNDPITLTATVRTVNGPMPDDSYDLVRKGYQTTRGGDWKMEIKRSSNHSVGRLHCVFKGVMPDGRRRAVQRIALVDIVDGRVHTVECRRTATAVQAVVDGRVFTNNKISGHISNNQPVIVGAKTNGDDVLLGSLDEVIIDIG